MKQQTIEVRLSISAHEYLLHYKGVARNVRATAVDGRSVLFPAQILQRYVSHDGIQGRFLIVFSAEGKFQTIERLA